MKFLTLLFGYFITRPNCAFCELYAKIRFVGESATSLIFFDLFAVLDCNDKYLNHCFAQNCSENRQFCGIRNKTWGIRNQFVEFENKYYYMCFVNLSCCGIRNCKWTLQIVSGFRKLFVESSNYKRNPHKFAESIFICGTRLNLRNWRQLSIVAGCRIRNKINLTEESILQVIVHGVHWNFVSVFHLQFGTSLKTSVWNPETYRHKIVRLSSAQCGLVMIF